MEIEEILNVIAHLILSFILYMFVWSIDSVLFGMLLIFALLSSFGLAVKLKEDESELNLLISAFAHVLVFPVIFPMWLGNLIGDYIQKTGCD